MSFAALCDAINSLKVPGSAKGASREAIKAKLGDSVTAVRVNLGLKNLVAAGKVVQIKGSFKLAAAPKAAPKKRAGSKKVSKKSVGVAKKKVSKKGAPAAPLKLSIKAVPAPRPKTAAPKAVGCSACHGGHRAHSCGRATGNAKAPGCGACAGGHHAHSCNKAAAPAALKKKTTTGCGACRGGHRAHTCAAGK